VFESTLLSFGVLMSIAERPRVPAGEAPWWGTGIGSTQELRFAPGSGLPHFFLLLCSLDPLALTG